MPHINPDWPVYLVTAGVFISLPFMLLLNPGSVGLQAYGDDHPVAHTVENGSPDARYAIAESTAQGWRVEHFTVPYDQESMAVLAGQRGRPEWAHALRTGRMPT